MEGDKKATYYETIIVKHMDPEKGQQEFDKRINEYKMSHDVESAHPMLTFASGSYVFGMVFCCETPNPY